MSREAWLTLRDNGGVKIDGGVVFCRSPMIRCGKPEIALHAAWPWQSTWCYRPLHEMRSVRFYGRIPRWWEFRKWADLLRAIRREVDA